MGCDANCQWCGNVRPGCLCLCRLALWWGSPHGYGWTRVRGSRKTGPFHLAVLCRKTANGIHQAFSRASCRKQPFKLQGENFALRSAPIFLSHVVFSPQEGFPLTLTDPLCIMDVKEEIFCSDCKASCRHKNMTVCSNPVQISGRNSGFFILVLHRSTLKHQSEGSCVLECSTTQYSLL